MVLADERTWVLDPRARAARGDGRFADYVRGLRWLVPALAVSGVVEVVLGRPKTSGRSSLIPITAAPATVAPIAIAHGAPNNVRERAGLGAARGADTDQGLGVEGHDPAAQVVGRDGLDAAVGRGDERDLAVAGDEQRCERQDEDARDRELEQRRHPDHRHPQLAARIRAELREEGKRQRADQRAKPHRAEQKAETLGSDVQHLVGEQRDERQPVHGEQ